MQNLRHPKKFDKGIVRFEKKLRSSRREAYLHTLKLGTVVRFSRNGSVNIMPDYRDTVLLSKSGILTNLSLDRFLTLIVRGIPSVNYTCHILTAFPVLNQQFIQIQINNFLFAAKFTSKVNKAINDFTNPSTSYHVIYMRFANNRIVNMFSPFIFVFFF